MTLSAYTGPSPEQGYVGYINASREGENVIVTLRPESADGGGTVTLTIPADDAKAFFMEAAAALAWGVGA